MRLRFSFNHASSCDRGGLYELPLEHEDPRLAPRRVCCRQPCLVFLSIISPKICKGAARGNPKRVPIRMKLFLSGPAMCSENNMEPEKLERAAPPDSVYKPRVSTWGVFPRPLDVSQTFGGGRSIPIGGVSVPDDAAQKREQRLRVLLERYRMKRNENAETEEERSALSAALESAERMLQAGKYESALEQLTAVRPLARVRGELGSRVLLQVALCQDALGSCEDARKLYGELQHSSEPNVRDAAKQLFYSFQAAKWLGVNGSVTDADESAEHRNTSLHIPPFADQASRYNLTFSRVPETRPRKVNRPGFWKRVRATLVHWLSGNGLST
ncbi:hypothetical protein, conserved [Cyanidioschyzon merolae strain 10D]|uniref:Uncharacterized protein n=1 Tax=Cyanidioschyzon merolae (strain NIES-3377 / 10D) TaxID=280699 RepID=M1V7R8_CYAM1|nr:hypothetical protein, conserved [Cyanidioschyzon merolae strain 10D]BAM80034.1 hypothetical protein, conserved [Cyanidioschyzon merolae strain 10D]|eukprot:XP_005536320.1 hypothetical protein, conserved [Cyanidioschyzon merolae strain 10D]